MCLANLKLLSNRSSRTLRGVPALCPGSLRDQWGESSLRFYHPDPGKEVPEPGTPLNPCHACAIVGASPPPRRAELFVC